MTNARSSRPRCRATGAERLGRNVSVALHRRLDCLDGGPPRGDVRDMTDAQLARLIARSLTPDQLMTWQTGSAEESDALLGQIAGEANQ